MKIVKHYWFVAIALITMISFSSCESDEERGFPKIRKQSQWQSQLQ